MASLTRTAPALPAREARRAVGFHGDRLGLDVPYRDGGFFAEAPA